MTPAFAEEQFKEFEVRVIKNKSFQKRMRLEVSGATAAIVNKSFSNTIMGGASLGFHFTEMIGLYGEGYAGYSFRDSDCRTLGDKFAIEPLLDTTNWWTGGGLQISPIYGKYQLASGKVVYFDWFFNAGAGVASVLHRELDTCVVKDRSEEEKAEAAVKNITKQKLQFNFGTGQKFYISDDISLNWNARVLVVQPFERDDIGSFSNGSSSLLLMLGASYFL